jgi:hypothetical protein
MHALLACRSSVWRTLITILKRSARDNWTLGLLQRQLAFRLRRSWLRSANVHGQSLLGYVT